MTDEGIKRFQKCAFGSVLVALLICGFSIVLENRFSTSTGEGSGIAEVSHGVVPAVQSENTAGELELAEDECSN